MKRFYKDVSVAPVNGGFAVRLDGKPLHTPAKKALVLNQALAQAIAEEWRGQGNTIIPATMPLMQLAATAIDHMPRRRGELTQRLLAYIDCDLLCLREETGELRYAQNAHWQPPLDWLQKTHGIALNVAMGLKAPQQSPEARRVFEALIAGLNDFEFIGVAEAASASGSIVLALALRAGVLTADQAFACAELESVYQVNKWGYDAEAKARHEAIRTDLHHLARWFALI